MGISTSVSGVGHTTCGRAMPVVLSGARHMPCLCKVDMVEFHGDSLLLPPEATSGCAPCSALEKGDAGLHRPLLCPIGPSSHAKAQHCLPAGWLGTPRNKS